MIKDYNSLLSLPIGTMVKWPEITGEEILEFEKITEDEIHFKGVGDSLGIIVPKGRLLNYPTIINFQTKQKIHSPMYIHQGDENGQTQRRQSNG